jgi:Mor family transcriptional regulator
VDIDRLEKLDSSCFHGAYCDLCKIIGQHATILIHEHYSGQLVSLPKKLLADHYVHEEIYREYDGANALFLAKKYGYTVSWIRKVVKIKRAEICEELQKEPATP